MMHLPVRRAAPLIAKTTLFLAIAAGMAADLARGAPGDLDPGFGSGGKVTQEIAGFDLARAAGLDETGRIIVAGEIGSASERDVGIARFTAAGTPDPAFGGGTGYVVRDPSPLGQDYVDELLLQPDSRLLIGGSFEGQVGMLRYRADGLPDTTFGTNGIVKEDFGHNQRSGGLALLPDGRIHWYGRGDYPASVRDLDLALFNPDGSRDTGFGVTGLVRHSLAGGTQIEQYHAMERLVDGKLLIGGEAGASLDWRIVRLNPNGTLDPSFGGGGQVTTDFSGNDFLYDMAIQPDGRIIAVGTQGGGSDMAVARYLPNGQLDPSFNGNGKLTLNLGGDETANAVLLQPDGRILVAGKTDATGVNDDMAVTRLSPSGAVDTGFGTEGTRIIDFAGDDDEAIGVLLQDDGSIVLVGSAIVSGSYDFALARLHGDPAKPPPATLDGGPGTGSADRTVRIQIQGKRLKISRRGIARLRLRCPTSEATPPCRGRLTLRTARKIRVAGKTKARRIILTKRNFRIAAGKAKALRLKFGRPKLRLLHRTPRARRVVALANVRDGAGNRSRARHRLIAKPHR